MMFTKTIDFPPIGQLSTQGQRKTWEGEWLLPEFGNQPFDVLIDGEKDAPTLQQQQVLRDFMAHCGEILAWINANVPDMLNEWALPDGVVVNAENLWQNLEPECITLDNPNNKNSYYGNTGDMLLSLGFMTPWSQDCGVQIYLRNGVIFDGIGSE